MFLFAKVEAISKEMKKKPHALTQTLRPSKNSRFNYPHNAPALLISTAAYIKLDSN